MWGHATPNREVRITPSWNKKLSVTAHSDATGKWEARLQTPEAGGPYSITLNDGKLLTVNNILIGQVWVCSGQSNMEMPVRGSWGQPVVGSSEAIIYAGQNKLVRHFRVERAQMVTPMEDCVGKWEVCSPQSVSGFSAVAYFFARMVSQVIEQPVGVISSSWGGTPIEAWMSQENVQRIDPKVVERDATYTENPWCISARLYNGMIRPIEQYTAAGFLWYQGESNIGPNYTTYAEMMQALVAQWREAWGNPQMPFYYVQIAPYKYDNPQGVGVPLIIEEQMKALSLIPLSGMISTTDIGQAEGIHPPHKIPVGERLARLALAEHYGIPGIIAQAPRLESVTFADSVATVKINAPSFLTANYQTIRGFEMAGEDRKFYPADAVFIKGYGGVTLTSKEVPDPVAVRYAFRNVTDANLMSVAGLPVIPFRSDNWPEEKQ